MNQPLPGATLPLCRVIGLAVILGCSSTPSGLNVVPDLGWLELSIDSASIPAAPNLFVNGFREIRAVAYDVDGQVLTSVSPTWTSSDPNVAKVYAGGVVTGEAPGAAIITAAIGRQASASRRVTVVPQADTVFVVAHRGFPKLFPENTLVAISGAFDQQADAVEVDVRWTRDGVAILMHDAKVDRTTNGTGVVSDLTFTQIQQLDACSRFKPVLPPCPVPTLRRALETAKGRGRLVLDLSDPPSRAALEALLSEVNDAGMRHDVILISFSYPVLESIRRLDPAIPLGYLTTRLPSISDVAALGRTAAMPDQSALLGNPQEAAAFIERAAARRVAVGAWVTSGPKDAQALIALGVRHITSDVPLDKRTLQ